MSHEPKYPRTQFLNLRSLLQWRAVKLHKSSSIHRHKADVKAWKPIIIPENELVRFKHYVLDFYTPTPIPSVPGWVIAMEF